MTRNDFYIIKFSSNVNGNFKYSIPKEYEPHLNEVKYVCEELFGESFMIDIYKRTTELTTTEFMFCPGTFYDLYSQPILKVFYLFSEDLVKAIIKVNDRIEISDRVERKDFMLEDFSENYPEYIKQSKIKSLL